MYPKLDYGTDKEPKWKHWYIQTIWRLVIVMDPGWFLSCDKCIVYANVRLGEMEYMGASCIIFATFL
jgi:hypothetical protein